MHFNSENRQKTLWPSALVILFGIFCVFLSFFAPLPVLAQQGTEQNPASKIAAQKLDHEAELADIRQKITVSAERKRQLSEQVAALNADRATLNRNLIEISQRSRRIEQSIERNAGRLEELRGEETRLRDSLRRRKKVLIEIIAALQRMGRKPPPALLVRPEDALSSVRSAILLGTVLPEIRAEADILVVELQQMLDVRNEIEKNRTALTRDLQSQADEEVRLVQLLEEKRRKAGLARAQMAKQEAMAAELAAKAGGIEDLIRQLGSELAVARRAEEFSKLRETEKLPQTGPNIALNRDADDGPQASGQRTIVDLADPARSGPAMPFESAKGLLPLPTNGVKLHGFGEKTGDGGRAKGLSMATQIASTVTSPVDGWVIYAGPFRSYGQLLIINVGDDYHVLLAGMDKVHANVGDFIIAGTPIATMGSPNLASSGQLDIGSLRPVLYIEFRKDGESIDPSPWWAQTQLEERNG